MTLSKNPESDPHRVRLSIESSTGDLTWEDARTYVEAGKAAAEKMAGPNPVQPAAEHYGLTYYAYHCAHLGLTGIPYRPEDAERIAHAVENIGWVIQGIPKTHKEVFVALDKASERDGYYFDVARFCCSLCVYHAIEVPEPLRALAANILTGTAKRPTKRAASWMKFHGRDNIIFFDVSYLEARGFYATGSSKEPRSACHLVADVWNMSYDNVERIFSSRKKKYRPPYVKLETR